MKKFDVIVVGSGPAGLTSAIYSVRAGLNTLIVEKGLIGGQIALTENIENYPGFESINGQELGNRMFEQAKKQGAKYLMGTVSKIKNNGKEKIVIIDDKEYITKTVIVALGSSPRKLNILGEKEFENKGVHYCALCDGPMYKNKVVAVIGGGDAAIKESLLLSNLASKVYVIHRRNELRAEKKNQELAFAKKNIEFIWDSEVKQFIGEKFLSKLKILNNKTNMESELEVSASFTYIGYIPATKWLDVEKDEKEYIIVNKSNETSVSGIFAAGDCTKGDIAQIATSVGEGAIAGTSASKYIEEIGD